MFPTTMSKSVLTHSFPLIMLLLIGLANATPIVLTPQQTAFIGKQIWQNEGLGKVENLTVWNRNEHFPSLGIGHFIWYGKNTPRTFTEQFPQFIAYAKKHNASIPTWLLASPANPWATREAFYADFDSPRMRELRRFLQDTIPLQVAFIVQRMEAALPKMTQQLSPTEAKRVEEQFYRVANQPTGLYALIDYINFKGEGTSAKERYKGEGWGLLQVLLHMDAASPDVMRSFVNSADAVLTRRVANAPRDERQWLAGWRKRLKTYLSNPNLNF